MFTSREWRIRMITSFIVGTALGFFSAEGARYFKDKIAKTLDDLPTVWRSLGQIQLNQGVWTPRLVAKGLKQTWRDMARVHRPLIRQLSSEIFKSDIMTALQTSSLVPVVTFVSEFFYKFSENMSEN
jgi:hypothetical protein